VYFVKLAVADQRSWDCHSSVEQPSFFCQA